MAYIGQTPTAIPLVAGDITDGIISEAKLAADAVSLAKMKAGTDGNIISYDASGNPVAIATGTDGQVLTSTGAGSAPAFEAAPLGKSFLMAGTYDMSTTGTIALTGAGFVPQAAVIFVVEHGASGASWALSTIDEADQIVYDFHHSTADTYASNSTLVGTIRDSATDAYAKLSMAYNSDGVTLTKTKNNSPTGTGYYKILLFG